MHRHSSRPAAAWICRRPSSDRAPGTGGTFGSSSRRPIPAALARRLGALPPDRDDGAAGPSIGLDSYDRFFPNQDTLPQGGFGNLIALPLQKAPRDHGNSVFLDDALEPGADQWAFLASVRKIDRPRSDGSFGTAEKTGPVPSACVCRRRKTTTTSLDRAALATPRAAADLRARCPSDRAWCSAIEIYIAKEALAARLSQPPAPAGSVSEPRVLSSAGDAPADLRHSHASSPAPRTSRSTSACRAVAWTSRPHARRSGDRSDAAGRTLRRQTARGDVPGRAASRAADSRPTHCWPTTPACWRPRPRSARRSSPRG